MTVSWVVGGTGLLGRQVYDHAVRRGHQMVHATVPWTDPDQADAALRCGAEFLRAQARHQPWNLIWVAGAGVVGTSEADLCQEHRRFATLLSGLGDDLTDGDGAIFLASSAGGVYAGSTGPPFSECTVPRPLAPYGVNKLRMEESLAQFAQRSGLRAVAGRISNLYGPGQNLAKPQGLISQLARAHLLRQPLSLYVSADTTRDYLYVSDCARMVLESVDLARRSPPGTLTTKILAAERPTTIAALLAEFRRLVKRRLPIVLADSPNRRFQVRDLRLVSTVAPDFRRYAPTTMPDGITATIEDLAGQLRRGQLRR